MGLPANSKSSLRTGARNSHVRTIDDVAPTNGRTQYAHEWHEIESLYFKILDAYYKRGSRSNALRFVPRLERLLIDDGMSHEAILGEECWSLIAELRGDLKTAINYRRNMIRLIRKLWRTLPGSPAHVQEALLNEHGPSDLADQYDLLAVLYHDAGQLRKAIKALWQSREICELHGVAFDGKDLLRDYLKEYRTSRVRA